MRLLKIVPDNTNFGFVALRHWAFWLTMLLSVAALGTTFARGLNLGVDFVGGIMIEEKFPTPPDAGQEHSVIKKLNVGAVSPQVMDNGKSMSTRLPRPDSNDPAATN